MTSLSRKKNGCGTLFRILGGWCLGWGVAHGAAGHCAEWTRHLPHVDPSLCEAARLKPSGAVSVLGVPLYQRDVPARGRADAAAAPAEPLAKPRRILVIGAIHGDELSAASVVFHWIAHAAASPAGMDWRFIPVLNPDGLLLAKPTRYNAHGVDLNRNFPTPGWDREALKYWDQRTHRDKRRYPGPQALSEPESRYVVQTLSRWKPDLIVSLHAPYGVLDFDGPAEPPQRLGRLHLDRVGIFPGSLGHYGGVHKGVPVVTIELPSASHTPTDPEMREMWVDLLRWIGGRMGAGGRP